MTTDLETPWSFRISDGETQDPEKILPEFLSLVEGLMFTCYWHLKMPASWMRWHHPEGQCFHFLCDWCYAEAQMGLILTETNLSAICKSCKDDVAIPDYHLEKM